MPVLYASAYHTEIISELNTQPDHSPVNASSSQLPVTTHPSLIGSGMQAVSDAGSALYDVGSSAYWATQDLGAWSGGFGQGWQDKRVGPLRDRLIGRAEFQGDFTPDHWYGMDAVQDLVGARAIEGYYGHMLTGEQIPGGLMDGGYRTQHFLFGVADFSGAAATGTGLAAQVPGLGLKMYPQPLSAAELQAMGTDIGIPGKTLGMPNSTYPNIQVSGYKPLPAGSRPPGYKFRGVDDGFNAGAQAGYKFPRAGAMDQGRPGAYRASHAEPKINTPRMRISRQPCKSCRDLNCRQAATSGRTRMIEHPGGGQYPAGIMKFTPDGKMINIPGGRLPPVEYGDFALPISQFIND